MSVRGVRGVLKGPKVSNKHSTYTPLAGKVVIALKNMEHVSKVVLGPIKSAKYGKRTIKIVDTASGAKVTVRDVNAVQVLYSIGAPAHDVEKGLAWLNL